MDPVSTAGNWTGTSTHAAQQHSDSTSVVRLRYQHGRTNSTQFKQFPTPHPHKPRIEPTSSPHHKRHRYRRCPTPTSCCHAEPAAAVHYKPYSYHDSPTIPSSSSGHAHTIINLPTTAMHWQKSEEKPIAPHRRGHRHARPLAKVPLLHLTHQTTETPYQILDLQGNSSVWGPRHIHCRTPLLRHTTLKRTGPHHSCRWTL
jgi:hypothetical protein